LISKAGKGAAKGERKRVHKGDRQTDRQTAAAMLIFSYPVYSDGLLGIVLFLVLFHTLYIYFAIFLCPS